MPIYEYHCDGCDTDFEMMRRISDASLPACPKCGAEDVRKLISLSTFHLKGTGWYVTDYADKTKDDKNGNGLKKEADSKSEDTKPTSKDKASDSEKSIPATSGEQAEKKSKEGRDGTSQKSTGASDAASP